MAQKLEPRIDVNIKRLYRDIKANGFAYVRSPIVVNQLKEQDKDESLLFEYDKEDNVYVVRIK